MTGRSDAVAGSKGPRAPLGRRPPDVILLTLNLLALSLLACSAVATDGVYRLGSASRDGIGKFYLGREISHVMGHQGFGWLERESRVSEEQPDRVVEALGLAADDVVADIGAGSGYFTFRMAPRVPQGKVLAVDIQPEMLAIIDQRIEQGGITNVEPIRGAVENPNLPASGVDLVLMVDAYHEFSHPHEMMRAIVDALVSGGRVVLVEYRAEDRSVPIKPLHKLSEKQAKKEMRAVGLRHVETLDILPTQHILVFVKP